MWIENEEFEMIIIRAEADLHHIRQYIYLYATAG
jgi:hypothetical protein